MKTILSKIQSIVNFFKKKKNVVAIVLSGSASYGDYKEGWSDIDLDIFVSDYTNFNTKNQLHVLTIKNYIEECKKRSVLAYILNRGILLYSQKDFKLKKPELPAKEYYYVLQSNCATAFRLRNIYSDEIKKTRQLYHSLRHYIRAQALRFDKFPLTDKEILCAATNILDSYYGDNEIVDLVYDLLKMKWTLKISNYEQMEERIAKYLAKKFFKS